MNVLLISPRSGDKKWWPIHFPLGLAYIASSLKHIKVSVRFIDFEVDVNAFKKLDDALDCWRPDYVGISVHAFCLSQAMSLAKYIRSKSSKIRLVAGGIYPSTFPEVFLKESLYDFVIKGDGEVPFSQLVQDIPVGKIGGLCYFDTATGRLHLGKTNYEPYDLEKLPFPDYETVPLNNYILRLGCAFRLPSYPIVFSRGCSGLCTYCTSFDFNKRHRTRDPKDVVMEIRHAIREYGAREIRFLDACFSDDLECARRLCDAMIAGNLSVIWHCSTRIDRLDEDLLDRMKRAGCVSVGLGLESGNEGLLTRVGKSLDIKKARALLRYCEKLGLFIRSSFMYGLPGETEETMMDTLRFALDTPSDFAVFNFLDLRLMLSYPTGTQMEKEFHDLVELGHGNSGSSLFPQVSGKRIKAFILKSNMRFYFRWSFIKKCLTRKINFEFLMLNAFWLLPGFILDFMTRKFLYEFQKYERGQNDVSTGVRR
ncbi:MAG: radical SAM protein [Candidatus Omnitrophica bacterium]|nr:radical SAM protein [Candidatus Omnitrophota bacterium]